MRNKLKLAILLLAFACQAALAQKSVYTTTGGEWMFSSANVTVSGANATSIIRFSPVFNFQTQVHRDFSDKAGLMTGLALRNVGFIYDDPFLANTRYKVRSYNIGIPIALKFGKMDGKYFFVGYELEIPINYKQKTFVSDDKTGKFNEWFSARTPTIYNTLFVGVQMPQGVQLKFKYYATNFFNQSYTTANSSGALVSPYANITANVFYISLSFQILKGTDFYYKHEK